MAGHNGPITETLFDDVVHAIDKGLLDPGTSLSERELAKRGNCSLGTAHIVLTRLVAEGWVEPGTRGGARQPTRVPGGEPEDAANTGARPEDEVVASVQKRIRTGAIAPGYHLGDRELEQLFGHGPHVNAKARQNLRRLGILDRNYRVTRGAPNLARLQHRAAARRSAARNQA